MVTGVDLVLIGIAAVRPTEAYIAAAFATAGSLLGCTILFYIARKGGQRYLEKYTASGRGQELRLWFQKYGLATVFVPALSPIPLPTKVFVLCAGALGTRLVPFLLVVLAARVLRYTGLAYLGSQLGAASEAWLEAHAWHIAGVALGLFALVAALVKLGGWVLKRGKTGPSS